MMIRYQGGRENKRLAGYGLRALAVGVVGALALTSCTALSPEPSEELAGEIRVLTVQPNIWKVGLQGAAESFEAANPGTTIKIEDIPRDGAESAVQTIFVGGNAPCLAQLEPPMAAQLASGSFLAPLNELLASVPAGSDAPLASRFVPGTVESVTAADGNLYLAPWSMVNVVLGYNESLFEAAGIDAGPATWDEWLETNEVLEENGEQPLYVSLKGDDAQLWWVLTTMLQAMFRPLTEDINLVHADGWSFDKDDFASVVGESYGADELYVAFRNGLIDPLEAPQYRAALELLLELKPFLNDDVVGSTRTTRLDDFVAQKYTQQITINGDITLQQNMSNETSDPFKIGTVQIPTITEANYSGLTAGGMNPLAGVAAGFALSADCENTPLAEAFLAYLTTPEVSTAVSEDPETNEISAIVGTQYAADKSIPEVLAMNYAEIPLYGFGWPPAFDAQDLGEFNVQLEKLFAGSISVDEFLAERSASNLAALERNLQAFPDAVDQEFIDENVKN